MLFQGGFYPPWCSTGIDGLIKIRIMIIYDNSDHILQMFAKYIFKRRKKRKCVVSVSFWLSVLVFAVSSFDDVWYISILFFDIDSYCKRWGEAHPRKLWGLLQQLPGIAKTKGWSRETEQRFSLNFEMWPSYERVQEWLCFVDKNNQISSISFQVSLVLNLWDLSFAQEYCILKIFLKILAWTRW